MEIFPSKSAMRRKSCLGILGKGFLFFVVLAVLFYVEEDWRGARDWARAKADLEAQGESFDPAKLIPLFPPNNENFGAIPFFQVESTQEPAFPKNVKSVVLNKALDPITSRMPYSKEDSLQPDRLPYLGNWEKGERPDLATVRKQLEDVCRQQTPPIEVSVNAAPSALFQMLCPATAELRAAHADHPKCVFLHDYKIVPPYEMPLGPMTNQIKVAKVLSYEERLAFLSNQSDLALDDLRVAWKIDSGLRKEPLLISGLVSAGVIAIQLGVVNEGLADHRWSDQQLASLDRDLGEIDYLSESQFTIRGEVSFFMIPTTDYTKAQRGVMMKALLMPGTLFAREQSWSDYLIQGLFNLVPNGWFDAFKADSARFHLQGTLKMVDPASQRVFPEKEKDAFHLIDTAGLTPWWRNFLRSNLEPVFNSVNRFAYTQVHIDEARIACRLERYHLAHGEYPATLNVLVPTYGAALPHDIINGKPYHYKLNADGTFLLYSVGWNQKDDGGATSRPRAHNSFDLDWVWTSYPDLSTP